MNLHKWLAFVFVILALVGCVQGPQSQGQAPYAPYSPENKGNMPEHGSGDGGGGSM